VGSNWIMSSLVSSFSGSLEVAADMLRIELGEEGGEELVAGGVVTVGDSSPRIIKS
jgi:hypothetical protein